MPTGRGCVVSCSSQLFDIFGHTAPHEMRCFGEAQYSFCVAGDMAARFDRTTHWSGRTDRPLKEVRWLDFGLRQFCGSCRSLAYRDNKRREQPAMRIPKRSN
jgi:hypothetical protein